VLHLVGTAEDVATQLEGIYDESQSDGCVIIGDWEWRQVNRVGNQVLANLRRRGRVAPKTQKVALLSDRVGLSARK
jgi:alkanesulfonate monooxygenase SsuD/methylene tetrahydromethanopterin reductase-like flavin-dependent oxidoreductase (luciferase family)